MSTAPTSAPPPRRAARRRQLVDNLRDPIVVVEDAHQLQEWGEGAYRQFRPINAWQDWLVQQIGLTTFRVNRVQRVERRLRDLESLRAIDCWEEDRRVEVEELAAKHFAREPEHTICRLLCSPAGCDWLVARWEALAQVEPTAWTAEQKALACHLNRGRAAEWSPGFIAGRVAGLLDHKARLAEGDALARTLAESDLSEELSPSLKRVRRHEKELLTRLKWFIREAQAKPVDRWLDERFRPAFTSIKVEPTSAPPLADESDPLDDVATDPAADCSAGESFATACDETNRAEGDAPDDVTPACDETNRVDPAGPEAEVDSPVVEAAPMTPADRFEHRKRRRDPARELARLRRSRRQTG